MKYLIFIINLCFCFYACETPQNPCTKNGFSTSIYIKDLQYKPRKGKLYLYKENSNFEELINVVDSINIFNEKNKILFFPKDNSRFSSKYNYRLIIDDTICFDLSNFKTIPDTMGRTMGGWAIRCKLVSFKCNDSIYISSAYDAIDPPFEASRIIEKGRYVK